MVPGLATKSAGQAAGATDSAAALHTAVVVVSVPAVHVLVPASVYPLLHVGVHELPLARLAVHMPAAPFAMAPAERH